VHDDHGNEDLLGDESYGGEQDGADASMSRRRVLRWTAAGAALVAVPAIAVAAASGDDTSGPGGGGTSGDGTEKPAVGGPPATVDETGRRWSDAKGWGGKMPGPEDSVTLTDNVVLDTDATVRGLSIEYGGSLTFAAGRSVSLTSTENVVVLGELTMAPKDAGTVHLLKLSGVDESKFVGDGMKPLDTDVGVWVQGKGRLVWDGTPKTAWVRAAGSVARGDTRLRLAAAPAGWRAGDELVLTPTRPAGSEGTGEERTYSSGRIASISGRTVTLDAPTRNAHPRVKLAPGLALGAEVLNLTRNVRVEGEQGHRTHVHIMGKPVHTVRHTALRWVGPRTDTKEQYQDRPITKGVLGRYGLHFHMLQDHSRGTVVEGVVIREAGNHAFVAHSSHGIDFHSCISHDTWDDAYWWDQAISTRIAQNPTDELGYDHCVASLVRVDPPNRGYRLTAFNLGAGKKSYCNDCVAVGVSGQLSSSGFNWPEGGNGFWEFKRNVAHNNNQTGLFAWQNGDADYHDVPPLEDFVAYHNGGAGIEHGAYINDFRYLGGVLYGNLGGGVLLHAVGTGRGSSFERLWIDGAGRAKFGFATVRHTLPGQSVVVAGCTFRRHTKAGVALLAEEGEPDRLTVLDCEFQGNELWIGSDLPEGSELLLRTRKGEQLRVLAGGSGGGGVRKWNASTAPTEVKGASRKAGRPEFRLPKLAMETKRGT
jgi:hypothetical protein